MARGRVAIAWIGVVLLCSRLSTADEGVLPRGAEPAAIEAPHFPDRLHALVWRNWGLVPVERLAMTVGTSTEKIAALAESMGLPPANEVSPAWRRRGYITIVRRNWHLVPYEQLLTLVDMHDEELAEALREDDFLFIKLGSLKPRCERIVYQEPDETARRRAAEIAHIVGRHFGDGASAADEVPFEFIGELSELPSASPAPSPQQPVPRSEGHDGGLRYIYSYFGVFGDPLADAALDPYPEGLLARLAANGVNGVWLHVVLRQLAPGGEHFPEFGVGHEQRLENLRRLVERARRHGISVYLYINEPRAMPTNFFAGREELGGAVVGNFRTLCTSDRHVREWLGDSLAYVFREVPNLGGVFTITASENLTHCASHGRQGDCPRCSQRSSDEIIAEVNAVIDEGVKRASRDAQVIVWDWGWNGHGVAPGIIARLPDDVWLQSVSEWGQKIERGGVATSVGEYSLSVVGPGPRAKQQWELARQRGLKTVAKVQVNTTWELSAVPYLPVMDLVAEHCAQLRAEQVDGTMLSWSLGGYPSANLRIAKRFAESSTATPDEVLDGLARELYGDDGAGAARKAWTAFSRAFAEFPYNAAVVYLGPQQLGPANLLFGRPTGYRATMVGFPYDDLVGWRGPYPVDVFIAQMQKVSDGWHDGLEHLEQAVNASPEDLRVAAKRDYGVARAAWCHFASVANQARFVDLRGRYLAPETSPAERQRARTEMLGLLDDEIRLAQGLHELVRHDSRIGFEASNHYYYVAHDLVEKVLNCEHLRHWLSASRTP